MSRPVADIDERGADCGKRRAGLRFAMVTTFYPPYHFGGDGQAIRLLVHALARRGHEVEVIHDVDAWRMQARGAEPAPLTEPPGVSTHALRSGLGGVSCLLTHQTGRPLVHGRHICRILRRGFDVIHFHNISLVGGPGVLSLGQGIKLYTAHEHWLVCPSHVLWRHNREPCTGRECLRCVLRYRRPPQLWRWTGLLDRCCRHVDAFCAPSQFCADMHRKFGFPYAMHILPNFLPESDAAAAEQMPPGWQEPERPFFLFVGRLERIKGLQDVIPHFTDGGPAELWIAGEGTYESVLRKAADGRRCVRFLGRQAEPALRWLYRRACAVLAPSICYEVFPMVLLEAFREGTPVIARRLGPYPEIIEPSGGGILFESPAELAGALHRLAGDAALRSQLGQAAQHAFRRLWSEEVVLQRYLGLIASIAECRGLNRVLGRMQAAAVR